MKSTGITRAVDNLGRIVLPMELRRAFHINTDDKLEIFTQGDSIVLKKCLPACAFCDTRDGLNSFEGNYICDACLTKIKRL